MNPLDYIGWKYEMDIIEAHHSASFEVLKKYFRDRKEFDYFVSKMSDDKRRDFLDAMTFYKQSNEIKNSKFQILELIMVFSTIERIMGKGKEYQTFYQWLVSNKNNDTLKPYLTSDIKKFHKNMKYLYNTYNEEFGATRKVKKFFKDCLTVDDQNALVQGFTFYPPKSGNPKEYSFNFDCTGDDDFEEQVRTAFGEKKILLSNGANVYKLKRNTWKVSDMRVDARIEVKDGQAEVYVERIKPKDIGEVAQIMYEIRNQFVHYAQFPQSVLKKNNDEVPVLGRWNSKNPKGYHNYFFKITISITKIREIFERGVIKFYGITEREKKIV